MPTSLPFSRPVRGAVIAAAALVASGAQAAPSKSPAEVAGTWRLTSSLSAGCDLTMRTQRSDKGDYFLVPSPSCRQAMPRLDTIGRWAMPDGDHLVLANPSGAAVLTFVATGSAYAASEGATTYVLQPTDGTPAAPSGVAMSTTPPKVAVLPEAVPPAAAKPTLTFVASKEAREPAVEREKPSDLAGRYAVLREKRDTGCMVTLDASSHAKGADRAQLAPGCRDQGIVIFDPSAWQIVKGELVLTARAGHKTKLEKQEDGTWVKDVKEGGKPLGLKRL